MSLFVKDEQGRIVPRMIFDALDPKPGACVHCGGTGRRVESIDDERLDVLVPCDFCQMLCRTCNRYVKKTGHVCQGGKR